MFQTSRQYRKGQSNGIDAKTKSVRDETSLKQLQREVEWLLGEKSYLRVVNYIVRRQDKDMHAMKGLSRGLMPLSGGYHSNVVHLACGDFNPASVLASATAGPRYRLQLSHRAGWVLFSMPEQVGCYKGQRRLAFSTQLDVKVPRRRIRA